MPRTANGSIPLIAPAALSFEREERKNLFQQPTRQLASWWSGPTPLTGRWRGRELWGRTVPAFTLDNIRDLLLGQGCLGWGRKHPGQHRVKHAPLWQGLERRRGVPHRFHVTCTARQLARRPETPA